MIKIRQAFATSKELLFTTKNALIVKLTAFFLLIGFCLHAGTGGYSQTVTMKVKNEPLSKVFSEIEKQTKYGFVYRAELLEGSKVVDLDVKKMTLKEVLELCFKDQPLTFSIVDHTIIVNRKDKNSDDPAPPPVPLLDIKGRLVRQGGGEPVAGASIKVKGDNKKGTSTDENGFFSLAGVPENAILIISGTNIETMEWKVNGQADLATLTVKTRVTEGEQVIISTGYDKTPKERYVGSYSQLDSAAYERRAGMDIISRLDGTVTSVLFNKKNLGGGLENIQVRGPSTLDGPSSPSMAPLIILDNFPFKEDLNAINPNDIESITILKDAAAASIWGAQAGNGVIVITTKKGRYNQPLRIAISSNVTIQEKPDQYYYPQMSNADFVDAEIFLFNKGTYDGSLMDVTSWPRLSPVVELLARRRDGKISSTDSASQINAFKEMDLRGDLNKYVYRNAILQQHYVNLSGGNSALIYNFSTGYNRNLNNIQGSKPDDQFTINSNVTFRPFKNLEINTGINYSQSTSRSASFSLPSIYPYAQLADAEGNPLAIPVDKRLSYLDTAGGLKLLDWKYRPLQEIGLTDATTTNRAIMLNAGITYKFTNWLNASFSYRYNSQPSDGKYYYSTETYLTRNLINQYTNFSATTTDLRNPVPNGGILETSHVQVNSHNARAQLNFNKNLAGKHFLTAFVAGDISETEIVSDRSRIYGYNKENGSYKSSIDYLNPYPIYGGTSGSRQIPNGNISSPYGNNRFVSFVSNVSYTFNGKYTVYSSARKDGSNVFGVNTNRKWRPLWSMGSSWDISKEGFYNIGWIPSLRVRASYGYTGNPGNATGRATIAYGTLPATHTNLIYAFPGDAPNPDLRWEKVRIINSGIDFSLFKNRISGSFEIWQKKSTDVIAYTPLAPSTGINNFLVNVASLKGKGFDINLSARILERAFAWKTNFGFSRAKTIITKLNGGSYSTQDFISYSLNASEGMIAYGIASYRWAGLDPGTGDPRGYLNKQVSTDYSKIFSDSLSGQVFHGSSIPLHFGFISNSFSWKNFTLSANISYRFSFYFRKPTISYSNLVNSWSGHRDYGRRWQQPGDEQYTTVPSFVYPVNNLSIRDQFYQNAEVNVLRGDNIRLQDISLQYIWNNKNRNGIPFKNLRLFIYANNLNAILWRKNKSDLDPDFVGGANFITPVPKTWTTGISVNF